MKNNQTYIALLRGINVGGHHKVPMAELRNELKEMGFKNVQTLLNSGNIIFEGPLKEESKLEAEIASRLEKAFGFSIPVLTRKATELLALIEAKPFEEIRVTKDTRLYVSFLKNLPETNLTLPWVSEDKSYQIIEVRDRMICSALDLSVTKTPKAMEVLERFFGSDITTRNWNTLIRIANKLNAEK